MGGLGGEGACLRAPPPLPLPFSSELIGVLGGVGGGWHAVREQDGSMAGWVEGGAV